MSIMILQQGDSDESVHLLSTPTLESPPLDILLVSHESPHLKTYTAGEDGSRLAAMARELGLQHSRRPRRQVRTTREGLLKRRTSEVLALLLDSATEDARIRSVYSQHAVTSFTQEQPQGSEGVAWGSLTAAVLGVIKGMVGPAILYLPHGFVSSGYLIAFPLLILTTCMYLYSSSCLLECWRSEQGVANVGSVRSSSSNRQVLSYPELAFRGLGARGESVVKMGIALMQSGVCLTYLIFVPQNLHTSMQILLGLDVSPKLWLVVMVLFQVPLSFVRDIRKLTPTNLLANLLILYGLVTCLFFAISAAADDDRYQGIVSRLGAFRPIGKNWSLFIGTSVLLFEGSITLLVPLQEAVHGRERRQQFPQVYRRVILGIIAFYSFFGVTCWMAFGEDMNVVLTTSLPAGILATTVQLAYSIAVSFTFPLQNFPALEIACRTIQESLLPKNVTIHRNVLSSVLVLALAVVAVCTMDSLDKVVSLMGSLLGCPIAFVLPPLIHTSLCQPSRSISWGNRVVAAIGIVVMIYSSSVTIKEWR